MQVGFQLVTAYDAATIAIGPNRPWFERLTQFRHLHYIDDVIIKVRPHNPRFVGFFVRIILGLFTHMHAHTHMLRVGAFSASKWCLSVSLRRLRFQQSACV